jgi:hypothetical protein
MKKLSINSIIALGIILLVIIFNHVEAGGCSISEFSMNPTDPYTIGTHVKLHVVSNCGTVRFEIDGQPKAEIGSSEQWETWKTEETGSGTHEVCAVARGDGGWENADRKCRTVYVEGGQAPPSGSQQAEKVKCWVNSFNITPSSGPKGTNFNLASQGQCDGNMRAARFTIDGTAFGEHSSNTYNTNWNSNNASTGSHKICYFITGGDWSDAAKSCISIQVNKSGNESNNVAQGNQTTNNVPGQTEDSNPSLVDHPQGDPPEQQSSSSTTIQSEDLIVSSEVKNITCSIGYMDFNMYDIAKITPGSSNNLRNNPDISAKIIDQIPGNAQFMITGGPKCQNGYWWWQVKYNGKTGWTVQGNNSELWIEKIQVNTNLNNNSKNCTATASLIKLDNPETLIQDKWILRVNTGYSDLENGFSVLFNNFDVTSFMGALNPSGVSNEQYQDFWVSTKFIISFELLNFSNSKRYSTDLWKVDYCSK